MKKYLLAHFIILIFCGGVFAQSPPRTPREFFMLLPQKYFEIEMLDRDKNKFLERALEIEDNKNGYMKAIGDGSQESFEMALFKKSKGGHLVGLYVFGEWGEKYYFLDYSKRRWSNVSKMMVPGYKPRNTYELPRYGKTVKVFKRINFDSKLNFGDDAKHIYDLVWNGRHFVKKQKASKKPA